ncbi:hypothetical protein SCUCBS95973_001183 [Sporothrix curviconia]|uniref:Uncharacterized protein n=1 Tax=Sporothrix curviconia TaxID=1260050 RepID=A0ABP0AWK8_9PEZI
MGNPLGEDLKFTNAADVFKRLESSAEAGFNGLVIGAVSPADFGQLVAERDRRGRRWRLFMLPDLAVAIVTIPSAPHEQAHFRLYRHVILQLNAMGINAQWTDAQATTFNSLNGSGQGEAGVSESMASLRAKAHWWFSTSDYHMKVIVLVKVAVAQAVMTIEKWTAVRHSGADSNRRGATTTRSDTCRACYTGARAPAADQ